MSMALNIQSPQAPLPDAGYERVFATALENVTAPGLSGDTIFSGHFQKDLRLLVVVCAWALENQIMTSAETYDQMRALAKGLKELLEDDRVIQAMDESEYARLRSTFLDFAEVTCGVGIQRDGELFELLTGCAADGLPCETD